MSQSLNYKRLLPIIWLVALLILYLLAGAVAIYHHNLFLNIWTVTGIISGTLFVVCVWRIIRYLLTKRDQIKSRPVIYIVILVILLIFIFNLGPFKLCLESLKWSVNRINQDKNMELRLRRCMDGLPITERGIIHEWRGHWKQEGTAHDILRQQRDDVLNKMEPGYLIYEKNKVRYLELEWGGSMLGRFGIVYLPEDSKMERMHAYKILRHVDGQLYVFLKRRYY